MISGTADFSAYGFDQVCGANALIEPAQEFFEFPGSGLVIVAENLFALNFRIIDANQSLTGLNE